MSEFARIYERLRGATDEELVEYGSIVDAHAADVRGEIQRRFVAKQQAALELAVDAAGRCAAEMSMQSNSFLDGPTVATSEGQCIGPAGHKGQHVYDFGATTGPVAYLLPDAWGIEL